MLTNTTNFSAVTAPPPHSLLGQEQVVKITWALHFVVFPCLSVVGISGNVTSIVVLATDGIRKSSNVLLVALALSDVLFLVGRNNAFKQIFFANYDGHYSLSEVGNFIIYILFIVFYMCEGIGMYCSLLIPVIITGERLIAVFYPLKLKQIVTSLRIVSILSCIVVLAASDFIYFNVLCYRFEVVRVQGALAGRIFFTELFHQLVQSGEYELSMELENHLTGVVPIVLVFIGSVVIWVKVKQIRNRRRKLTSGQATPTSRHTSSLSKTTIVLMSVCILYVVCSGLAFIVMYVITSPALPMEDHLTQLCLILQPCLIAVNSIGNFIIYVVFHKKFNYFNILKCFSGKSTPC